MYYLCNLFSLTIIYVATRLSLEKYSQHQYVCFSKRLICHQIILLDATNERSVHTSRSMLSGIDKISLDFFRFSIEFVKSFSNETGLVNNRMILRLVYLNDKERTEILHENIRISNDSVIYFV